MLKTITRAKRGLALLLAGCLSIGSVNAESAVDVIVIDSPAKTFSFHIDPWVSLHHFAYHYARENANDLKLRGRVPLTEADRELLKGRFADACAALDTAYAPYLDTSLLFTTETRALAKSLAAGPAALSDAAVRDALEACMPVYQETLWPAHAELARQMIDRLQTILVDKEPAMKVLVATMANGQWPDTPIRVDISPYANWAGAYTDGEPANVTMSSQDPEISHDFAFELLFHESGHTASLATPIDNTATAAMQVYEIESPRFAHYVLFYLTGIAAAEILDDPDYVPFYKAMGLADSEAAAEFYAALEQTWDTADTLEERIDLALSYVVENR